MSGIEEISKKGKLILYFTDPKMTLILEYSWFLYATNKERKKLVITWIIGSIPISKMKMCVLWLMKFNGTKKIIEINILNNHNNIKKLNNLGDQTANWSMLSRFTLLFRRDYYKHGWQESHTERKKMKVSKCTWSKLPLPSQGGAGSLHHQRLLRKKNDSLMEKNSVHEKLGRYVPKDHRNKIASKYTKVAGCDGSCS